MKACTTRPCWRGFGRRLRRRAVRRHLAGRIAANNVLADVPAVRSRRHEKGLLPGARTTVEYNGKYYGMPWILDTKYLFYNKEILEKAGIKAPPKTWEELGRTGQDHQGQGHSRIRRSPGAGPRPKLRSATTPRSSAPTAASSSRTASRTSRTAAASTALKYMVDS